MNPFKIYRAIEQYANFVQSAASFTKMDDELHDYSETEIADLQSSAKRIIRISVFCLVGGGVILPVTTPWIRYFMEPIPWKDAVELGLCGLMVIILLMPISVMMGAAIGCLFASPEFMRSPLGQKWMELVGTENMVVSRIICALVATILLGVLVGYVVFIFCLPHLASRVKRSPARDRTVQLFWFKKSRSPLALSCPFPPLSSSLPFSSAAVLHLVSFVVMSVDS